MAAGSVVTAVAGSAAGPAELPTGRSRFFWEAIGVYWCMLVLGGTVGAWVQMKDLTVGLVVTELLGFALPSALFLWRHRGTFGPRPFAAPRVAVLGWAAIMAACLVCVAVATGLEVRRAAGVGDPDVRVPWQLLVVMATLPPVCEELMMRPVLQRAFSLYWGPRASVLGVALLFALMHSSWLRFGETFVLGVFAGIVFLKTGSYWACVAFHAVSNALGPVLFTYGFAGRIDWLMNPVVGVLLVAVASVAVWRLTPAPAVPLTGLRERITWLYFGGGAASVRFTKSRGTVVAYWVTAGLLMLLLSVALAVELGMIERHVLRVQGEVVEVETEPMSFTFEPKGQELVIRAKSDARTGSIAFGIYGPDGERIDEVSGRKMSLAAWKVPAKTRGTHTLRVTPRQAAGHWEVHVRER